MARHALYSRFSSSRVSWWLPAYFQYQGINRYSNKFFFSHLETMLSAARKVGGITTSTYNSSRYVRELREVDRHSNIMRL